MLGIVPGPAAVAVATSISLVLPKEMGRADLAEEIVAAQRQVMKELLRATLGDLLEADLTMAQMKALAVIERQPECSIGMLSAQLGVKPPAASLVRPRLPLRPQLV